MNTERAYSPKSPVFWILRDATESDRRTAFHIQSGDYFGTLAAILSGAKGILEDNLRAGLPPDAETLDILQKLKEDLMFLQSTHSIKRGKRDID